MTLTGLRQRKHWRLLAAIFACAIPARGPAQSVWTGSVNNNWSESGNWNNNNVPGDAVNEDAILNSGAPIVNANFSLRHFNFGGGTLHGSPGQGLDVLGVLTWSAGSIASDAFVNVTGSLGLSGTLNNAGVLTASITAGAIGVDLGTILNNSGTLSVSGSTLNLRAGVNSGRLEAGTGGTILFQGVGSYILAAGSSLGGNGVFSIASAVNLQESVSVTNLAVAGSILGGTLTTGGEFKWTSGEMKGGGKTTIATGSLQLMTSGTKSLESRELVNNSTMEWSGNGDFLVHTGATVMNNSRFTIGGDATMSAAPLTTAGTLINAGIFEKTAGAGTSSILIPFNNTGTVSVTSGTLKVTGGSGAGTWIVGSGATMIFAAGSANPKMLPNGVTIGNSGTLINAGYLSAPAAALSGNDLIMDTLTAAELNILGDLPAEAFEWNRGVISGPGTSTTAGHTFDDAWGVAGGRTLSNSGLLTWAAGASWGLGLVDVISAFDNVSAGTIQNNGGAMIIFNADGMMGLPMLPGALKVQNTGEIKVSDDKSMSIHGAVNNNGTVLLGAGATLNLAAGGSSTGTFHVGDDANLILSGNPSHTLGSSVRIDGIGSASAAHNALFDAAATNFSGQVGRLMTLRAGADGNSGAVLNLLSGSMIQSKSLILSGGSVNVQSGASIDVPKMQLNGGRITVQGGSSINVGSATLGTDAGLPSTLKLNDGATFNADSFELKASGLLWLEGGTLASGNTVQMGGFGSVIGSGTIDASVNATAAVVTPGVNSGEAGALELSGGLTLGASSMVGIDIDANTLSSDTIDVGDALELGGAFLFITVVGNPSSLTAANSFVILSSAARSGTFTFASINPGKVIAYNLNDEPVGEFRVDYTSTEVLLTSWIPEPSFQASALAFGFLLRRRRAVVRV